MRPSGAIIFFVACFILNAASDSKAESCGTGKEPALLVSNKSGVDRNYYQIVRGEATRRFKKAADAVDLRKPMRIQAYKDAMEHLQLFGTNYSAAARMLVTKIGSEPGDFESFGSISLFAESDELDHSTCSYTYRVELFIPKVPTLADVLGSNNPVTKRMNAILAEVVEKRKNKSIVEIFLDREVEQLLSDKSFRVEVKLQAKNQEFIDRIKQLDDDSQRAFNLLADLKIDAAGFSSSQYSINSLLGSIIEQSIVPSAKIMLKEHRRLKVRCVGFTDRKSVVSPIAYYGASEFGAREEFFRLPVQPRPAISTQLENNIKLSFARAHEAAAAFAQMLGAFVHNEGLTIEYTGAGEDHNSSESAGSNRLRRVSFLLSAQ